MVGMQPVKHHDGVLQRRIFVLMPDAFTRDKILM